MKYKISYIDIDKVEKSDSVKNKRDRLKNHRRKMTRLVNRHMDWDYSEIYELLEKKLRNILDYLQNDSVTYESEWKPQWIKRAISLAHHLSHNRHYPAHININNAKRFREVRRWKFNRDENREEIIKNIESDIVREAYSKIDMNRLTAEDFYDLKAKHLFFEILKNYIENWWD